MFGSEGGNLMAAFMFVITFVLVLNIYPNIYPAFFNSTSNPAPSNDACQTYIDQIADKQKEIESLGKQLSEEKAGCSSTGFSAMDTVMGIFFGLIIMGIYFWQYEEKKEKERQELTDKLLKKRKK
jgi:nicotinamide riboside transporter PnuC